jgi:hypothetical protein
MFAKIARLADLAQEFPEFELEFQTMILKLAEIKPAELNECRKIYESKGKLYAVKYWKFHFDIPLLDAKHQVEDLAAKHFWILPQDR